MIGQLYNGRVVNVTEKKYEDMSLFNDNYKDNRNGFAGEVLQGIQETSPITNAFFSKENCNWIQDNMRYRVWQDTGKIIGRQSDIELHVIMRSISLQYSTNNNDNIREQLLRLNEMVLRFAVPQIKSEMDQYVGYLNSIQRLPVPIAHSENVSSKGSRTLKSVTTTF